MVDSLEMSIGNLQILEYALPDRDVGHNDHELLEAVLLVQLIDRAQVDIGLAGAGLHFDGEVRKAECLPSIQRKGKQCVRLRNGVRGLHLATILEQSFGCECKAVRHALEPASERLLQNCRK